MSITEPSWGESLDGYKKTWEPPDNLSPNWESIGYFEQRVPNGLEIVVFDTGSSSPTAESLREVHKKQQENRATPVLIIALWQASEKQHAKAVGPDSGSSKIWSISSTDALEKLVQKVLASSNHIDAARHLMAILPRLENDLPGLHNAGLFATHELRNGVPRRRDWVEATREAWQLLDKRGHALVEALGFEIKNLDDKGNLSLLTASQYHRAIAVFLQDDEPYETLHSMFSRFTRSPVSDALLLADQHNVDWVIITRLSEIRLYAAKSEMGVSGGSRTEKYLELDLDLLPDSAVGYLPIIFSAGAMEDNGSLNGLVMNSSKFAAELATRLRDRVYKEAVPALANSMAERISNNPTEEDLRTAYEQAMLVLFRLLFLAYGEGRELLPIANQRYSESSLTRIAQNMLAAINEDKPPYGDMQTTQWMGFKRLCNAIDKGQPDWGLPRYNGGLFSTDSEVNRAGAEVEAISDLPDKDFGPALAALLLDDSPEGKGLVDFRELSVREFGTIYEGLLESQLSVARFDMTLSKKGFFIPAKEGDPVEVEAGKVYFHNRSGARKATGSYYTKDFAVDHLLDQALKPALDNHIKRLEQLLETEGEEAASRAFFDFRCADIAMGSGHFLIVALDMTAERLTSFLGQHELPSVAEELTRLLTKARTELEELSEAEDPSGASEVEITREALLRRQIARHCIYGVDRHQVAVELAKVAIWVHTFVPGLPLTSFSHNLRFGDSLVGVSDLLEVKKALNYDSDSPQQSLFFVSLEQIIDEATTISDELANIRDDDIAEQSLGKEKERELEAKMKPARQLFDLVTAKRAGVDVNVSLTGTFDEEAIENEWQNPEVQTAVEWLHPLHFQAAFPEVFKSDRQGFDCLLGNPPWEQVKVAKNIWWGIHSPGIRALSKKQMNKEIAKLMADRPDLVSEFEAEKNQKDMYKEVLKQGEFDLGPGDTDLYKAFAWRFYWLVRDKGYVGVILPRSAVSASGLEAWRKVIFAESSFIDVTILLNSKHWVFDDVDPRYSFALCAIQKGITIQEGYSKSVVRIRGPFNSYGTYLDRFNTELLVIPLYEFLSWSGTAAFPIVPPGTLGIFRKLKQANCGGGGVAECLPRPRPIAELHSKLDEHLFIQDQ